MCWDIVGVIVVYFFVVETKQLSLEEISEIFESPNPKERSFELARQARLRAKRERDNRMEIETQS